MILSEGMDSYSISCDELMGGGLLSNIGTHIIDIITFVTGLRAKRVNGIVKNFCQLKDNGIVLLCFLKNVKHLDF